MRSAADLGQIETRRPNRHQAFGDYDVASSPEAILTSGWAIADGGRNVYWTESFGLADGGLVSLGAVEGLSEVVLTASGDRYWTGDINGHWLRGYAVSGPPMTAPLFEVRSMGDCGGFGDKPGCNAGGVLGPFGLEGMFLQCPFVDDGGVRFVSIRLRGEEIGDCEGNYAYVGDFGVPSDPDGYLDVIDLSPFVATAPYR